MKIFEIFEIESITELQYTELNYSVIENQRKNIQQNRLDKNNVSLAFDYFSIPMYDGVDTTEIEIDIESDQIEIEI